MFYLFFIYIILFLILAWRKLDWAVLLIIIFLPSYLIRFNILGIPFTLLEAMILFSFVVWFIQNYFQIIYNIKKIWHKKNKKIRYPFDLELILLLIISFSAVAVAGFSETALGIWKAYFFEPVLFFILVANLLFQDKENKFLIKIIYSLGISALILSIVAFYQKITGNLIFNDFWANAENRRVTSVFPYPNALGLYLGPLVLIFFGYLAKLFKEEKKIKSKIFFIIVFIVSLLSIYFAKSEGALIGVLIALLVFGIFHSKKSRIFTILLILISVLGIFFSSPVKQYVLDKITLMDKSGQIRRAIWSETWEMLSDGRLLLGAGLARYQQAVASYHQEGIFIKDSHDPDWLHKVMYNENYRIKAWQPLEVYLYPHNIFLNFWSELGFFGMILFIWMIFKYFWRGIILIKNNKINNNEKDVVLGLICAMIVIVIHGLVDVPFFKNDLSIIFLLLFVILGSINIKKNIIYGK